MSKAEERGKTYALHKASEKLHDYYGNAMLSVVQFDGYDIKNAYIDGYHQAEEDLHDISWIKEVSGVKDMSRAKEEALKAYPPRSIAANYDTINRRDAFEYGYLKAEKDLELTWEDLALIRLAFDATEANINLGSLKISPMTKEYYEEVLKRFNKERKQQ